ncbi:MAG: hypothetical protein ACW99F_13570 [Candidatus Hodarchaeales archaeon]|jgi:hypothetical protein
MGPNLKQMREINMSISEVESQVFETELIPIDVFKGFKASSLYPECYEKLNDVFHEDDFQSIVSCLIQNALEFSVETQDCEYQQLAIKLMNLIEENSQRLYPTDY